MAKKLKPKPGEVYHDHAGRRLTIEVCEPNDRLGREVRGKLKYRGERKQWAYSCTIEMWREIWRDKVPPIPIHKIKIG